jgi:hypothetical protein
MFHGHDRGSRADRYRKVAAEYTALGEAADNQFLRAYYYRIADDYMARVNREVPELQREGSSALPGAADEPSSPKGSPT